MRIPALALSASLVLLTLGVTTAAAEETWGCHTYEIYHGDAEQGAGVSPDDGAVAVAAGGWYVVSDGFPIVHGWIVSVWVYQEWNGQPGLQRGDDVCDERTPEYDCDCPFA